MKQTAENPLEAKARYSREWKVWHRVSHDPNAKHGWMVRFCATHSGQLPVSASLELSLPRMHGEPCSQDEQGRILGMAIHGKAEVVQALSGRQMADMLGTLFSAAYDFGRNRGVVAWQLEVMPELLAHLKTIDTLEERTGSGKKRAVIRLDGAQLVSPLVQTLTLWVSRHLKAS